MKIPSTYLLLQPYISFSKEKVIYKAIFFAMSILSIGRAALVSIMISRNGVGSLPFRMVWDVVLQRVSTYY